MKNVTITGASGFVGTNLKEYLKSDYEISTLSVRYIPNQKFNLNGDIIIHLAGKAHDLKKVSVPDEYYKSNFELTKQLFDSFLESDASVFIFMSTVKAVADDVNEVLTEEFIPNPKTHYGIAKHNAEKYILNKKLPESKKVYILRPCMIHGPGNKGNLNLLYKLVLKGIPWPLGDFKNNRSFLSIENFCFIVKEILENSAISSGVYQLSDNKPISTNELFELLNQSLNKKNKILIIPSFFIKKVARAGDFLRLPLNSERLQKLTENYVVSNEKIINAIGKTLPLTTEKGLLRTFESFRKEH